MTDEELIALADDLERYAPAVSMPRTASYMDRAAAAIRKLVAERGK